MIKIILTGGPCGGKTSIQRAIKRRFGNLVVVVPDVATVLLRGGFLLPGRDVNWSREWEAIFNDAVFAVQRSFEDVHLLRPNRPQVMICDRGLLDIAAHSKQGVSAFCRRYGVSERQLLSRYEMVIHLPSLATTEPAKYCQPRTGYRFGSLEYAKKVEIMTKRVWAKHPRRIILQGSLEKRKIAVIALVRSFLSESYREE